MRKEYFVEPRISLFLIQELGKFLGGYILASAAPEKQKIEKSSSALVNLHRRVTYICLSAQTV
jgi:hypothetical protein